MSKSMFEGQTVSPSARMRELKNRSRFGSQARLRAERMKLALECVYANSAVTVEFGKTAIRVRVADAIIRNRAELRLLEQEWTQSGVAKDQLKGSVIYSFGA